MRRHHTKLTQLNLSSTLLHLCEYSMEKQMQEDDPDKRTQKSRPRSYSSFTAFLKDSSESVDHDSHTSEYPDENHFETNAFIYSPDGSDDSTFEGSFEGSEDFAFERPESSFEGSESLAFEGSNDPSFETVRFPLIFERAPAVICKSTSSSCELTFHGFTELPIELQDQILITELFKYSVLNKSCLIRATKLMRSSQLRFLSLSPREICSYIKTQQLYKPFPFGLFHLDRLHQVKYSITLFDKGCKMQFVEDGRGTYTRNLYFVNQILEECGVLSVCGDGQKVLYHAEILKGAIERRGMIGCLPDYVKEYVKTAHFCGLSLVRGKLEMFANIVNHYGLMDEYKDIIDPIRHMRNRRPLRYDEVPFDQEKYDTFIASIDKIAEKISNL